MKLIYNNPGNIRPGEDFAGETDEFYTAADGSQYVIFDSPEMGLRALFIDLKSKIKDFNGNIDQIVNKYAPPGDDNPTSSYASFVKGQLGKETVSQDDLPALVSAFVRFENKKSLADQYLTSSLLQTAEKLSAEDMPKTHRLSDALLQIQTSEGGTLTSFPQPPAFFGDSAPTTSTPQPSVDLPIITERQAQVAPSTDEGPDLPLITERQKPIVSETDDVSNLALEKRMLRERQQLNLQPEELNLSRPLIEQRQNSQVQADETQLNLPLIEERVRPEAVEDQTELSRALLEREEEIEATSNQSEETQDASEQDAISKSRIDPNQIQIRRPFSLLEQQEAERLYEEDRAKVTFGQAVDAAFAEENTMSWLFSGLPDYEPDPDFRLTPENLAELTEDIPEDRRGFITEAVSLPHAQKLRERALASLKNQETLTKYGWGGVGLQVAAATLDVPAIAATVFTEGALAPLIWGGKATRLARTFRAVASSGASAAAIESYLVSQNAMKDPYDILYAAAGGFVLGGATDSVFGAISRKRYRDAGLKIMNDTDEAQAADVNTAMIDRGIDTGVSAAENPASRPMQDFDIRRGTQELIDETDAEPMAAFGKIRFDMVGQLKSSGIGLSRRVASFLGEDAVEPGEITADLIKTVGTKRVTNKFYNTYDRTYNEWAKASGIGIHKRTFDSRRSEFGRLVSDEIEEPGSSTNPHIIEAANNVRTLFRDMLGEAKRSGVKGFDSIPENPKYFSHLWDGHRYLEAKKDFGKKLPELLKKSLLTANRTLEEDMAEAIANGMVKKIIKREIGMDAGLARMFSTSNKEALRDILLEEEIVTEAQADRIIDQLDFDREGVSPRARRRLEFDLSASVEQNGKTLHIKDLMERDTEAVVNAYVNQMQGRIALAKKGIESDADFEKIKKDIIAAGEELNLEDQAARDIEKLDVLHALISGRTSPLIANPSANGNRLIRLLMDYSFIRVMNQVGFAQIAELGNAVSIDGTTALLRVIPEWRAMVARTANGELEDRVSRELEAFVAPGVDRNINAALNKYSYEDMYGLGKGDTIDKAIGVMQPLKRLTADISGLAGITALFERTAAKIAAQSLVDIASGVKKLRMKRPLGKSTLDQDIARRLKSFGLDEEMWPRVVDQIKKHTITVPSMFSRRRKLKAINMDAWDDIDARDALTYGIARWTRQSIQQNDVGNLNIHMTSTMGKVLTQFRAFMLVSYSKQFLHNIQRRDFAAFTSMMWSLFYGGNAYILQTHVNALGREDKREFLEERLSVIEIGKAAFVRSSWASFLPGAIDTAMFVAGQDPLFGYKRSTGLASDLITGNPVFDLLDTTQSVVRGGSRALFNEEYQWSRGQQRALNSLLPFQNAVGIKNVLNTMMDGLPQSARVTEQ